MRGLRLLVPPLPLRRHSAPVRNAPVYEGIETKVHFLLLKVVLVRNAPVYEGIETACWGGTRLAIPVRNAPVYEGIETQENARQDMHHGPECPGL